MISWREKIPNWQLLKILSVAFSVWFIMWYFFGNSILWFVCGFVIIHYRIRHYINKIAQLQKWILIWDSNLIKKDCQIKSITVTSTNSYLFFLDILRHIFHISVILPDWKAHVFHVWIPHKSLPEEIIDKTIYTKYFFLKEYTINKDYLLIEWLKQYYSVWGYCSILFDPTWVESPIIVDLLESLYA